MPTRQKTSDDTVLHDPPLQHGPLTGSTWIQFDPNLARIIGTEPTLVLQKLHYMLVRNQREPNLFVDGRVWSRLTYDEWVDAIPCCSMPKIKRIILDLEKSGLIVSANYNHTKYDRTKWYSIDYSRLQKTLQECGMKLHALGAVPVISAPLKATQEASVPTTLARLTRDSRNSPEDPTIHRVDVNNGKAKALCGRVSPQGDDLYMIKKNQRETTTMYEGASDATIPGSQNQDCVAVVSSVLKKELTVRPELVALAGSKQLIDMVTTYWVSHGEDYVRSQLSYAIPRCRRPGGFPGFLARSLAQDWGEAQRLISSHTDEQVRARAESTRAAEAADEDGAARTKASYEEAFREFAGLSETEQAVVLRELRGSGRPLPQREDLRRLVIGEFMLRRAANKEEPFP